MPSDPDPANVHPKYPDSTSGRKYPSSHSLAHTVAFQCTQNLNAQIKTFTLELAIE